MRIKKKNYIFEGVDENTLRKVIKQYLGKEALQSSSLKKRKKEIMKKSSKNLIKLMVSPIQKTLFDNKIFYLYGGIMLPCDFSLEVGEVVAERMAFRQSCQKIEKIEKRKHQLVISYSCHFMGLQNFQFLIDIYNKKGKQLYRDLANSLQNFQRNIVYWNQAVEEKYQQMYADEEQYMKRIDEFTKTVYHQVDQLDQTKLYMFGIILYDYEKRELVQRATGFSEGFLSILGTEADQFSSINLRCGQPWNNIGDFIIESIIVSLLPLSSGSLETKRTESDTVIVTLDGFYVPCKEIRQYFVPEKSMDLGYIEMGYGIVEFDVPLNGLKQLLTLRANRFNDPKTFYQFDYFTEENFEYSMTSQIFLEKYYPQAITDEYLCCKYRSINQKSPLISVWEYEKGFEREKTDFIGTSEMQLEALSSGGTMSQTPKLQSEQSFSFFEY